ncbi:CTD small phosphatase-like protein 2-B isoform X2 [Erythrolamprus reginae]|uniref:CTD small phosphatase-like protein 2-B isoform X2 n=1 Tax=Erythrolamprus reginae TaxID=121349 RepID=UPI00396CABE7
MLPTCRTFLRQVGCPASVRPSGVKPFEMFSLSSWERQNITTGCVPFESYFSFPEITDPETPKLKAEKPLVDAMSLGHPLQEASPGVKVLNMFTQPRGSQKLQRRVPRKLRRTPKNTLVLEVEGTLALSSLTAAWDDASTFTTPFQDSSYQIFVFSTAKQDYADQMLKVFGPHRKLIRHRFYQEDCLCSNGSYVKDLSVIERDLDRTVAVATSLQAFPYQMSNVIVVPKWQGDRQDKELLRLIPALQTISRAVDIRTEIERKHRS